MLSATFVCLLILFSGSYSAPSYSAIGKKLGLCSRKAPELDSCLRNRLKDLIPDVLKNGFSDLDLEPSDPAFIRELRVYYNTGNWSSEIVTKNTKTHGLSAVQVQNVRAQLGDSKDFHVEIDFTMPTILIEGDYKIRSNLLGVLLNTKGFFNISMENLTGTWDVKGVHINKKGEDFVRISRVDMLPQVGDMKVYASNLVPDNEELSQAAITFFNQNWKVAYDILLPFSNDAWSKYMADILNLIFLRVPFKDLFPDV